MRSLLSITQLYLLYQRLVGGIRARQIFVRDYVKPKQDLRILDVGCGPGYIVEELPLCDYVGYDINQHYIDFANTKYASKGIFVCKELTIEEINSMKPFDIVLLNGVLHHLDDTTASHILELSKSALKPDGQLLTMDGCYIPGQHFIDHMLQKYDRGKFVRKEHEYLAIVNKHFSKTQNFIRPDLFYLPYSSIVILAKN
ncbi:class I SAM-dependent methyltransferase [Patescibacteria group bacterium]|nr:class I SAM-dependent methyltransferase [Patescibacteria group bacterium]